MQYAEDKLKKFGLNLWSNSKVELIFILIAFILLVSAGILLYKSNTDTKGTKIEFKEGEQSKTQSRRSQDNERIIVDIGGAVNKPAAYQLPKNTRLIDAIKKADGLSDIADQDYFNRNFNLAKVLIDGEKIYIPSIDEVKQGLPQKLGLSTSLTDNQLININSASSAELDKLPGVGQVTVDKIINGRPYSTVEDLIKRKIVNKGVWVKIKGLIIN